MTDTNAQPTDAAVVETGPADTADADMGAAWDRVMVTNGADRGEGGKFESAKGEAVAADPAEKADAVVKQQAVAETPAPAHLPQAIKSHWAGMSEDARKAWSAHVSEQDRKFGDLGKQFQAVKPIADRLNEAIQKYPDFKGMTPDQLAKGAAELAAVQVAFNKNPVGTLMELAKSANVLPQLAQIFSQQAGRTSGDQNQIIAGLEQKIAKLEAQQQRASNPDTIRETVSSTLAEKEAKTTLENWAKAQPFYADVEADLPHFVAQVIEKKGRDRPHADILSEAYDMAINANPEVRAKVREAEAKATAAQPDPQRAEKARKAASINVKSSANGKDRTVTEDEAMGAAWDRVMTAH